MRQLALFLVLLLVFCSCTRDYKIREVIQQMEEVPFHIETNGMIHWFPDSMIHYSTSDAELKVVVYSDSTDCTGCYIKQLNLWNDFIEIEEESKGKVVFIFIMDVNPKDCNMVYNALNTSALKHSVFIDTLHSFRRENKQIPDNKLFYTFVLNKDNKVVLIGNPLFNERIEKLFQELTRDQLKLKTRQ